MPVQECIPSVGSIAEPCFVVLVTLVVVVVVVDPLGIVVVVDHTFVVFASLTGIGCQPLESSFVVVAVEE